MSYYEYEVIDVNFYIKPKELKKLLNGMGKKGWCLHGLQKMIGLKELGHRSMTRYTFIKQLKK